MADRRNWMRYRTMGAVALDAYRESTARPLPQETPLPQKKSQEKPRQEQAGGISLLTVLGGAVCAFLLILVFFSSNQLNRARQQNQRLEAAVSRLSEQRDRLQAEFDELIDRNVLATQARLMGMHGPERGQVVAISVPAPAAAEEQPETKENPLMLVWQAIWETAASLVEYLQAP